MLHNINYFNEILSLDFIFWFCALAGSAIFVIRFFLNLFGLIHQDFLDPNVGTLDHHHDAAFDHSDFYMFKLYSIQTITGFFMMFGWTALSCRKEFGLNNFITIILSITMGVITAFILRLLYRLTRMVHSSGNIFNVEEAIGKEAYVYQRIPKDGVGKISLSLNHLTHEIDAISGTNKELSSFTNVKIISKKDDNTVVVTPL